MGTFRAARAARPGALAAALLLAAGCSEGQEVPFRDRVEAPSSEPQEVEPAPGTPDASPLPTVRARYEDRIASRTITTDNVRLLDLGADLAGDADDVPIGIVLLPSPDGREIVFRPVAQLLAPRTFEVQILGRTGAIRFEAGNLLDDLVFRFTTAPDPQFVTAALPDATAGEPYTGVLEAAGGTGDLTFAISEGALPAGLDLNPATGVISGTPTTPGTATFTATVTDEIGRTGEGDFSIEVTAP